MLRLLTFYISLFALGLVISSPIRLKAVNGDLGIELAKTYVVTDGVLAKTQSQLKAKTEQVDLKSIFFLPRNELLLGFSKKLTFELYHGHQSFYGSFYPSGPSPPQVKI